MLTSPTPSFIFSFSMKKFVIYISSIFIVVLVVLELLIRLFHLYPDINKWSLGENGRYLKNLPNQTGEFVRGSKREIFAKFSINTQGWNALSDYEENPDKPLVSIVGGSGVESFYNPPQEHIGEYLKSFGENTFEVHAYGNPGGGLHTSGAIIDGEETLRNSQIIFVMHAVDKYFSQNFLKGLRDPSGKYNSALYKVYENIKLLVYLNVNHKLLGREINYLDVGLTSLDQEFKEVLEFIRKTYERNIVFVINRNGQFEDAYLYLVQTLDELGYPYIDLTQTIHAEKNKGAILDFGFDVHPNSLLNKLIAKELHQYLESHQIIKYEEDRNEI